MCGAVCSERVWSREGIIGLYRGWLPPLWGSSVYRSLQFAVFEALYTKWNTERWLTEIPGTSGLQTRVVAAGFVAATTRTIIESPVEYAKVRRQTGQKWDVRGIYTGFGMQWARTGNSTQHNNTTKTVVVTPNSHVLTGGLMTTYFILIDSIRRKTKLFNSKFGQFLASGGSAVHTPHSTASTVLLQLSSR